MALSLGVTGAVRGAGGPGDRPESDADAERLERQVRFLSAALAAARSESEALRARLDGAVLGAAPGEEGAPRLMEGGARVLDAKAGAVLEEWLSGSPYPGQGDRLVVVADGE